MRFWIDVEDAAGTRQGSGPITAALHWRSTRRLDRAGEFSFEMPATDSKASLVTARRVARCKMVIAGAVVEVGAGIIDSIATRIGDDGQPLLVVSGPDLLGELRRVVLDYRVTGGFNGPNFDELDDIPYHLIHLWANAKLSGWTLADEAGSTIGSGTPVTATDIYATFRDDSVLAGLIAVAQASEEHFRLGTGRAVEWVNSWVASGLRAVYGAPNPVAVEGRTEIVAIGSIERVQDSQDIVNRLILYGSGESNARQDLFAADVWPDGTALVGAGPYTRTIDGVAYHFAKTSTTASNDYTNNSLQDSDSETAYGPNEMALAFKNITPISNTAADVTAAANQLLRSGYQWLKTRSQPQDFYRLSLVGAQAVVKPGTTIGVTARRYVDGVAAVAIDTTLNILEATVEVGVDGLRTTELLVSTTTRQPESDVGVLVERMAEAVVSQAHQQTGPNSYTESHVAAMDDANQSDFYFWLGEDITQISQILLRFRVDPLRSTVRSVASSSMGSGASSAADSGASAPGGATSNNTSNHTHNETGTVTFQENSAHSHNETTSTHVHTIGHTHTFTPAVTTTYGLHVEASAATYGHTAGSASVAQIQADIDILVGGSDRSGSIAAEPTAAGWFKLDVTDWLIDAATLRPSSAANVISFAKAAAAAGSKSAQIIYKLQVRCTVQSVNYS